MRRLIAFMLIALLVATPFLSITSAAQPVAAQDLEAQGEGEGDPTATETLTPTPTDEPLSPTATNTPPPTSTYTATAELPAATNSPAIDPSATVGASTTPTPSSTPDDQIRPGDTVRVLVSLNMRSSPSTSGNITAVLPAGTQATVLEGPRAGGSHEWVRLDTGSAYGIGWSVTLYLEKVASGPSPTPTTTPDSVVRPGDSVRATVNLNMRSANSTTASVVAVLPSGTTALVLEGPVSNAGYQWVRINAGSYGTGWSVLQYLEKTGTVGTATPTRTPSPTGTATATYPPGEFPLNSKVVVNTGGLNLRSGPSTSNSVVAVLTQGAQGTVLEGPVSANGYLWYRASFSVGTGWVASSFLAAQSAVTPTPAVSLSQISVWLDCTGNPERIQITNNGSSTITINSIDTLVDRTAAEPFVLNQSLGAKQARTYVAGSNATGQYRLTTNLILTNTAGDQEGVRIVTSSGTVTKRCPAVASGEKWIEVDLSDQFMIVWQGSTRISSTYVSTGKRYFETPTGTFYTNTKYVSQTMSGCIRGECYNVPNVPHVHYFTNYGHAIHGAYWHNDFGSPRSHGCVNVPLAFGEWLFYWAPLGTRVWIHQ
jgi:lipoprotein-anchoring transpeptidase ErfK/SrfK/uncharacterized protein YraI